MGAPRGVPFPVTATSYTSSGPSRFEMKKSRSPRGDHSGLWFIARSAVTCTGAPPAAGTMTMSLGALFAKLAPGSRPTPLPETHAISGACRDHRHQLASKIPAAITRLDCPSAPATNTVSFLAYTISRPSGDQLAVATESMGELARTPRACPPSAGATATPL